MSEQKWTKGPLEVHESHVNEQRVVNLLSTPLKHDEDMNGLVATMQYGDDRANAHRVVACWNACLDAEDPHEMRESIRGVIATLNGNSYGLTVEDQLEALRMACRALEEAMGGAE